MIHLIFAGFFNQSIVFNSRLEHVIFGHDFIQPIVLTSYLTNISFSQKYNRPLWVTSRIVHLAFGHGNSWMIDNLPNNIKKIISYPTIVQHLVNMPNVTIKEFDWSSDFKIVESHVCIY